MTLTLHNRRAKRVGRSAWGRVSTARPGLGRLSESHDAGLIDRPFREVENDLAHCRRGGVEPDKRGDPSVAPLHHAITRHAAASKKVLGSAATKPWNDPLFA